MSDKQEELKLVDAAINQQLTLSLPSPGMLKSVIISLALHL